MKSALNKINDSIGDMEENYKSMKSMAVTAKQFVYQDANGVWRWVTDPEPNWRSFIIPNLVKAERLSRT